MRHPLLVLLLCLALLAVFLLACDGRDVEGQHPAVNTVEETAGEASSIMQRVLRWGHDYEKEKEDGN